jgi:hypothetical protein
LADSRKSPFATITIEFAIYRHCDTLNVGGAGIMCIMSVLSVVRRKLCYVERADLPSSSSGPVAQLVEHRTFNAVVAGSSPARLTKSNYGITAMASGPRKTGSRC